MFTDDFDKEDEFMCVILSQHSMSAKLKMFAYFISKYNPKFRVDNPQFYNDLCLLNSARNRLAHHPAAFDEKSIEAYLNSNKIIFAKTRYEKQYDPDNPIFELQDMSEDDVNGLIAKMDAYISKLRRLTGFQDSAPDVSQSKA
jgi:hypothetical protein